MRFTYNLSLFSLLFFNLTALAETHNSTNSGRLIADLPASQSEALELYPASDWNDAFERMKSRAQRNLSARERFFNVMGFNYTADPAAHTDTVLSLIEEKSRRVGPNGELLLILGAHGSQSGEFCYEKSTDPADTNRAPRMEEVIQAIERGRSGLGPVKKLILYIHTCYAGKKVEHLFQMPQNRLQRVFNEAAVFTTMAADESAPGLEFDLLISAMNHVPKLKPTPNEILESAKAEHYGDKNATARWYKYPFDSNILDRPLFENAMGVYIGAHDPQEPYQSVFVRKRGQMLPKGENGNTFVEEGGKKWRSSTLANEEAIFEQFKGQNIDILTEAYEDSDSPSIHPEYILFPKRMRDESAAPRFTPAPRRTPVMVPSQPVVTRPYVPVPQPQQPVYVPPPRPTNRTSTPGIVISGGKMTIYQEKIIPGTPLEEALRINQRNLDRDNEAARFSGEKRFIYE